ncbi:hypothetical protein [Beijerinckia sp. L45]|uniref:hypothetical protein n=1 Tax=Beijerinckia sp. L45 TaxID=1641855 RepID=UPI00131BA516|nr:hypothetical protein [Beijerinckia sp. L45]
MKVHYIACAASSSLDAATNQLSLFHILDEISGPAFPLPVPSFCVAALFEREANDAVVQAFVLTVSLESVLIASFTMSVDFSSSRRNRSVNTIRGLTIPSTGLVTISLLQKTRVLAVWEALAIESGTRSTGTKTAAKTAAAAEPRMAGPKNALAVN